MARISVFKVASNPRRGKSQSSKKAFLARMAKGKANAKRNPSSSLMERLKDLKTKNAEFKTIGAKAKKAKKAIVKKAAVKKPIKKKAKAKKAIAGAKVKKASAKKNKPVNKQGASVMAKKKKAAKKSAPRKARKKVAKKAVKKVVKRRKAKKAVSKKKAVRKVARKPRKKARKSARKSFKAKGIKKVTLTVNPRKRRKIRRNPSSYSSAIKNWLGQDSVMEVAGLAIGGVGYNLFNDLGKKYLPANIANMIAKAGPLSGAIIPTLIGIGLLKLAQKQKIKQLEGVAKGIIASAIVAAGASIYEVTAKDMIVGPSALPSPLKGYHDYMGAIANDEFGAMVDDEFGAMVEDDFGSYDSYSEDSVEDFN